MKNITRYRQNLRVYRRRLSIHFSGMIKCKVSNNLHIHKRRMVLSPLRRVLIVHYIL